MHAIRDKGENNKTWHLILGVIDIILGIMLMGHIAASVTLLRIIVGIWFVFRGVSLFSLSQFVGTSWLLILGGVVTILLGLLILFNPLFGDAAIIFWIAMAFVITGIFNILLSMRLRPVLK
jgi:uncharacterized membrane protein HdeD (DUF308 family)